MCQNFSAKALAFEQPESFAPRAIDQARELIRRYPNLSEIELARLINLYRELSALDMARMLSDENLAPNLDRFAADHRSTTKASVHQYAALVGYAVVGVAMVAWAVAFAS
jgi:predicted PurR-regulated permease PerM